MSRAAVEELSESSVVSCCPRLSPVVSSIVASPAVGVARSKLVTGVHRQGHQMWQRVLQSSGSPNVARATWASGCSALEGACSVGLPLKHNLSTTNECTRVQHIYTHKVTRQQVTI